MTLFQDAASWLGAGLQSAAGRSVSLVRSGRASDAVTAWVSMQEYAVASQDEFATAVTSYDWSFLTSELPYTPRAGDRIRETLNGSTVEYEACELGDKPAAEWLDTSGKLTVVHSKRVL